MQKFIAQQYILFEGRMYAPGEELPTHNQEMAEAWLAAGTAVYVKDEEKIIPRKASLRTATPGLAGDASASESEDGDNVVGKIPKSASRKKK